MTQEDYKEMQELGDAICEFCPYITGDAPRPFGRPCEGDYCETAYENYLEEQENKSN